MKGAVRGLRKDKQVLQAEKPQLLEKQCVYLALERTSPQTSSTADAAC